MLRQNYVPVLFALLLLMDLLAVGPAIAEDYEWLTYVPGEQVQFGVPDTDERSFWIMCDKPGKLSVGGPTPEIAAEGARTKVSFTVSGKVRTAIGSITERGDGMNFEVEVPRTDPVLQALLHGEPVTVSTGGATWTVPGKGAKPEISGLLSACTARKHR
jgi:hypothetical protein